MNPLTASVLLAFAAAATWAPWRKPDWKSPAAALTAELVALAAAVAAALLVGDLVAPTRAARFWGRVVFLVAAYWYGFVVAAKALARFRALDDRDFAEYFVIGTLASLLHALLVAVGVRLLL